MIRTTLESVLIGTPQPFREDGELSAIVKISVDGELMLGREGLEGNQVADILHHGGQDKAVHHYPIEHYEFWRSKYPDLEILQQSGAFGENFSSAGFTEDSLCLGDVFRVGDAIIQCTQPRQPCWKLNHRFGQKDVLKTVLATAKSGSYFRVLQTGKVCAGDKIMQIDRFFPEWPLDRLFYLIIGGKHEGQGAVLDEVSQIEILPEAWRRRAAAMAHKQGA